MKRANHRSQDFRTSPEVHNPNRGFTCRRREGAGRGRAGNMTLQIVEDDCYRHAGRSARPLHVIVGGLNAGGMYRRWLKP